MKINFPPANPVVSNPTIADVPAGSVVRILAGLAKDKVVMKIADSGDRVIHGVTQVPAIRLDNGQLVNFWEQREVEVLDAEVYVK